MPYSHTTFLAGKFSRNPLSVYPYQVGNYTQLGLAKLLMFGRYVRAQAGDRNVTAKQVVLEESKKLPYTLKKEIPVTA